MNKNYIHHIAESKAEYHRSRAKMSYEDKVKIIIELQKIDAEMRKNNRTRKSENKLRLIWELK
jgi:hypothetical protein